MNVSSIETRNTPPYDFRSSALACQRHDMRLENDKASLNENGNDRNANPGHVSLLSGEEPDKLREPIPTPVTNAPISYRFITGRTRLFLAATAALLAMVLFKSTLAFFGDSGVRPNAKQAVHINGIAQN